MWFRGFQLGSNILHQPISTHHQINPDLHYRNSWNRNTPYRKAWISLL